MKKNHLQFGKLCIFAKKNKTSLNYDKQNQTNVEI